MSADIIPFITASDVDEAWADFAVDAQRLAQDPKLIADRQFFEGFTRKQERFQRLFLRREGR